MWLAPGYKKFFAFAANYGVPHIIPDKDKEEEQKSSEDESISNLIIENQVQSHDEDSPMTSTPQREQPVVIEFSDDKTREPIKEPPNINSKHQAALRQCHERLNHISFTRIHQWPNKAFSQGILPTLNHQCVPAAPMAKQQDGHGEPRQNKGKQAS
jgi:hypothetical protein